MRVIAGTARSIPLKTPEGEGTRPTTDRIKETLFNILSPDIYEARVLDLFAGSGQLAIEALSRGAERAVLIDSGKKPMECIKANIKKTRFEDRCVLIQKELPFALGQVVSERPFSLIFIDAPYDEKKLVSDCLSEILRLDLLPSYGIIVVESGLDDMCEIPEGLEVYRIKTYKTNQHIFLKKTED